MAQGPLTKRKNEGDVVLHIESPIRCYESGKIVNPDVTATSEVKDAVGIPVKKTTDSTWTLVKVGDEANATGIIADVNPLEALAISGTSAKEYKILAQGPATLNESMMGKDHLGGDLGMPALKTALAGNGFNFRTDSSKKSKQTT